MPTLSSALLALAPLASNVQQDYVLQVPVSALEFVDSKPDLEVEYTPWQYERAIPARSDVRPAFRVWIDESPEIYLSVPEGDPRVALGAIELHIGITGTSGDASKGFVHGEFQMLTDGEQGWQSFPFKLSANSSGGDRHRFLEARYTHYRRLYAAGLPGAAWFRYQAKVTRDELRRRWPDSTLLEDEVRTRNRRGQTNDLDRTFGLFSGGRALSENLALDEVLRPSEEMLADVSLDSIEGVTVRAMEFKVEGEVDLDPLAKRIPADQHALFFPTFGSMIRVIDEARANGTPVLQLLDASSEDAHTQARYERQLCLPLDQAARRFGGALIESVAITGGDPYLRTGTDVSVLLRARDVGLLVRSLDSHYDTAEKEHGARRTSGRIGDERGFDYVGVETTDRAISSYRIILDGDVVVGNSRAGLERLVEVANGGVPPLADATEYAYFRQRYPRSEREDMFFMLTDATIRRWCSPRWRIGASRRTRVAALLADGQAADLEARLVHGEELTNGVIADLHLPGGGLLRRLASGRFADAYGGSRFLHPVVELDFERVTNAERDAYERFRRDYQRRWSAVFDPIAGRLRVGDAGVELDLSIEPLVFRSNYRELVQLSRGAVLGPKDGDPHPGAPVQFGLALGRDSWIFKDGASLANAVLPGMTDPLGWVGDDAYLWLDDAPEFYAEAAASEDPEEFVRDNIHRLPFGIRIESTSPLRLAAVITGLRGLVDTSAPGLVDFETREYDERPYVAILPRDLEDMIDAPLAFYYATLPDAFVLTMEEGVLQRALARHKARRNDDDTSAEQPEWLGESAAIHLAPGFQAGVEALFGNDWSRERRTLAWQALPILDEWHRRAASPTPLLSTPSSGASPCAAPAAANTFWTATHTRFRPAPSVASAPRSRRTVCRRSCARSRASDSA